MSKIEYISIIIIAAMVALLLMFICMKNFPIVVSSEDQIPQIVKAINTNIVKVGQVWIYDIESTNPFEDNKKLFKILDIRDGYIKYALKHENDYDEDAVIDSERISTFTMYKVLLNTTN